MSPLKTLSTILALILLVATGSYVIGVLPALTTENVGGEKVVLVHGFGRSNVSMLPLESALAQAGYDVHSLEYPSREEPPEDLVDIIASDIARCCIDVQQKIHLVGHSFGGLLLRDYLGGHRLENLGHVVLIGTPNKGSELANPDLGIPAHEFLLEMAGPSAQVLHTGPDGYAASLPAPDYSVGVIAGERGTALSAKWLPSPNDGVVSVESARLDGMTDFIAIDVTHWDMRRSPVVARSVIEFLQYGKFHPVQSD
ncbi:MAG: alpha/beta fold hydrolase [Halioglobus sp.]